MVQTISAIADVQNYTDGREVPIDKVGVRGLRHPVRITGRDGVEQHTVADFSMYVDLPHQFKGTHMSRFVQLLNEQELELSLDSFSRMLQEMTSRLDAGRGHVEMRFPYFIEKKAPVSGIRSLMDYEVGFIGELEGSRSRLSLMVRVPVTSLCPCSKQIADYGAHNQRSHITVNAVLRRFVWIEELVEVVEAEASSPLYGLLKRVDEKFVTEQAYDNAKFVEDMVRDIACRLGEDDRIGAFSVEVENFESIHNHSAYARIEVEDPQAAGVGMAPVRG